MTTLDLFTQIGTAQRNIEEIQSRFYEVIKMPLPSEPRYYNGVLLQNPKNLFTIHNGKTGESLSEKGMGKSFFPTQQQQLLNNILLTVHEFQADLDLDTLKFNTYCGGSKIEFTIETKPLKFLNAKSIMDETNIMLSFTTSYDGSKSNRYAIHTQRVVCTNGMTVKEFQGELKGRNTLGGQTKILSYAKEIAEIINGADNLKARMVALDKIAITKEQIAAFKLSLFGFNDATLLEKEHNAMLEGKKSSTSLQRNMLEKFDNAINIEFPRTGETAFGLLQATTYYTNHLANDSKEISQEEYIRFFQGGKTNDKAQELIFALLEY